jgi:hypothetical protein
MRTLSTAVVALALAVAGCSGDEPEPRSQPAHSSSPGSPTTSEPSSSSPSATASPSLPGVPKLGHDPMARKELRQALVALLHSNTASYRLDFGTTGTGIQERASYQIEPRAFEIRRYLSAEEGTYTFDFLAVGRSAWMRAIDSPETDGPWPCWVDVADLAAASDGPGQLLTSDVARTSPPNPVVAASYAVGREYSDVKELGSIIGTLDLVSATALLGSQAVLKLGLDPKSKATVVTYFDVRGGMLQGFTVGLRELYLALEAAGVDVPVDTDTLIPGTIKVVFEDQGAPVSISAPGPQEIVDIPPGQDSFADEMAACGV